MSGAAKLRCAVYTRKSSEEGLEQEFNSLDAQREACAAYVASQVGLGWRLLPNRYDDGGISGGTMDRPALQRLLQDIRDHRVEVVVVYKIDRLTRSLLDFSKIIETFDGNGVSFVSVTQAFNTTSSMGRLTLNVLLSFAQFEREVTAERIRDKIAASRKKGMWMGGRVPFGYHVHDRKLVAKEPEASQVRYLFKRYLELKSVLALAAEINGEAPDVWSSPKEDEPAPSTGRWSRGKLYYLLSNQLYVGRIRHRDQHFEGEHEAIVDADQFAAVQALLASHKVQRKGRRIYSADIHLLTGLVYDETGDRLSPAHASNHGKRYRYYVSSRLKDSRDTGSGGWRIPAQELEAVVKHQMSQILEDRVRLADWVQHFASAELIEGALENARARKDGKLAEQRDDLRSFVRRITVDAEHVTCQIDREALVDILCGAPPGGQGAPDIKSANPAHGSSDAFSITLPIAMKRRGIEARIVIADHVQARLPDQNLIDVIARAHHFLGMLTDGTARTIAQVAAVCCVHRADVSRILPLAFLSPKIVEAIFTGRQPADLTARHLARLIDLPLAWQDQEAALRI